MAYKYLLIAYFKEFKEGCEPYKLVFSESLNESGRKCDGFDF